MIASERLRLRTWLRAKPRRNVGRRSSSAQIVGQIALAVTVSLRDALDFALVARSRDLDRILEHIARTVREPEFQAALEQQRGEDSDQDGGNRRNRREQGDQPHVQASAARAPLPPRAGPRSCAHKAPSARSRGAGSRSSRSAISGGESSVPGSALRLESQTLKPIMATRNSAMHCRHAVVEAPACPLPLEPAFSSRCHRQFGRTRVHSPRP